MHQSIALCRESTRKSRPPKLPSSCDSCGASKVKCDRGQPECGRCISHGLPCTYGISRKTGKPPRGPRLPQGMSALAGAKETSSSSSTAEISMDREQSALSSFFDQTWAPMNEGSHDDSITNCLNFKGLEDDWSSMQFISDFGIEFNDDAVTDLPTISSASSQLPSSSSPPRGSHCVLPAYLSSRQGVVESGTGSMTRNGGSDHGCLPKLHEILQSLLVHHSWQPDFYASPSSVVSEGRTQVVPLDRILQLNRQATEDLLSLASCSCARLPHVALLYASIISQILAWYRQAAGCSRSITSQGTSASTGTTTTDLAFQIDESYGVSMVFPESAGIKVFPSRVAIGTFDVDDQCLQTAMKIHLLSGEMKRVKGLMSQLRSHTDGQNTMAAGADEVFQSVHNWLDWEFSNIFDMMQSQLKELNI